jgi:hypothetical protein
MRGVRKLVWKSNPVSFILFGQDERGKTMRVN